MHPIDNSFGSLSELDLGGSRHAVHRLDAVPGFEKLPLSLKILLENLLRHEDGNVVTAAQIDGLVTGRAQREAIAFFPSRVFLHDTNGVPVLTDLAALREAVAAAGGDPRLVSPRIPGELTVDHSVAADVSGRADASRLNVEIEYGRNAERYRFLKWGTAFDGFKVIPPGSGIMHQINLEHLARVVERRDGWAYPDTCAGTDSHTTMVNGLGVLAWGIGGMEAEAALLGQPITMTVPRVVGVELVGDLAAGVTATDLVLTITERLRRHGVVGKFVEFTGPGVRSLPVAHRATIANMAPEYGATAGMFPIDDRTLDYLRFTGRSVLHVAAVETYSKEQGLWHDPGQVLSFDELVRVDMTAIEPVIAGPRRPHDRVPLRAARDSFQTALAEAFPSGHVPARSTPHGEIDHGAVAIAAITSCTNTSNPHVMVCAGLLARNARQRGLTSKPWVKTSLAPGSKAVTKYLDEAGLTPHLDALGFQLVGYGCMTCIGNSGPLLPAAASAVAERGVQVVAVLSGNRNFDGRINNDVSMNYLASPPLVIAYALAGTMQVDLVSEPLGVDSDGQPVFLADVWPTDEEIDRVVESNLRPDMFVSSYAALFDGDDRWRAVPMPTGQFFEWAPDSTYLRRPPFLDGISDSVPDTRDLTGARALLLLGDSVTTDHISPAGRIPAASVAGSYLAGLGVSVADLNTYASRRGNFHVMVRGAFTNPRLRNQLLPAGTGGLTLDFTDDDRIVSVYDAATASARSKVPLVILAGQDYGGGSSRDWAAKVTSLLGVRAVLARSFERIHRSNLIQLGVLPLQFLDGDSAQTLGLDGTEVFDVAGIAAALDRPDSPVTVRAQRRESAPVEFAATVRVDTAREADYFRHGGILPFVYRRLLAPVRPSSPCQVTGRYRQEP